MPNVKWRHLTATSHKQTKILTAMSYAETFQKRTPVSQDLEETIHAIKQTQSPGHRQFTEKSKEKINKFLDLNERNKEFYEPFEWDTKDWLISTITQLKMYTAAGADGIPNEHYYLLRSNEDMIVMKM